MKIVYLILSARIGFFQEMEKVIEETYLKDSAYPYYFVTEGAPGTTQSYVEGHYMYCACKVDTTCGLTFRKMCEAFRLLKRIHPDYDVVVRPNTSTWINTEGVRQFLKSSLYDPGVLYGGSANTVPLYSKKDGKNIYIMPYIRGQAFIMSREIVNIILNAPKTADYNNIDDVAFGAILMNHYAALGENFMDHIATLGVYSANLSQSVIDVNRRIFSRYLFIQIKNNVMNGIWIPHNIMKDYEHRNTEPLKMQAVDEAWQEIQTADFEFNIFTDRDFYSPLLDTCTACWTYTEGCRYTKQELEATGLISTADICNL